MRRFLLPAFALVFATTVSAGAEPWKIRAAARWRAGSQGVLSALETGAFAGSPAVTVNLYGRGRRISFLPQDAADVERICDIISNHE